MSELKVGFEMKKIRLPLGDILPVRQIRSQERIDRYETIVKSIKAVGLVEPLMVYPQKGTSGKYLLVDGHLRLQALREIGESESPERARTLRRDRTLVPLRPLCYTRARSGLRAAQ
ncbi:MAG TPA: ParB N-terminal domain-containing protein [Verrucomicrobiae bacterium]